MTEPWYATGLKFRCTRCGKCCRGEPGFVWVSDQEIRDIAAFRGEPVAQVVGLYTRLSASERTLRERANGDCVFWDREAGCTVYPVRPAQCRTFPFWESHLETPETWNELRDFCPGAGHGDLIPVEEITRRMNVIRL